MKYLCLAYGDEKDWKLLSKGEQDALLAQDQILLKRGDLVSAVGTTVTTVRAWDGTPSVTQGAFAESRAPLAGFSVIEAKTWPRRSGWSRARLVPEPKGRSGGGRDEEVRANGIGEAGRRRPAIATAPCASGQVPRSRCSLSLRPSLPGSTIWREKARWHSLC